MKITTPDNLTIGDKFSWPIAPDKVYNVKKIYQQANLWTIVCEEGPNTAFTIKRGTSLMVLG